MTGNDNLINALVGGAILMIRDNTEAFIFVDDKSKRISIRNAKNLVAYNLVKIVGAEHPHDIYYLSTFDDFIKKNKDSVYFKSDMEDTLTIEGVKDELPADMKRNDVEYFLALGKWRDGYDEESKAYRTLTAKVLLNWKQK